MHFRQPRPSVVGRLSAVGPGGPRDAGARPGRISLCHIVSWLLALLPRHTRPGTLGPRRRPSGSLLRCPVPSRPGPKRPPSRQGPTPHAPALTFWDRTRATSRPRRLHPERVLRRRATMTLDRFGFDPPPGPPPSVQPSPSPNIEPPANLCFFSRPTPTLPTPRPRPRAWVLVDLEAGPSRPSAALKSPAAH